MSPRRFDGWEPAVFHVTRTTDDGETYVEVVREPEWSEDDRTQIEALIYCQEMTCPGCGCWLPESTHGDFAGLVEKDTCYGCRSLQIIRRDDAERFKRQPTPAAGRPAWDDGLRYSVRSATPSELVGRFRPE